MASESPGPPFSSLFVLRIYHQLPPQPRETMTKAIWKAGVCHSKPSCTSNPG